jgi:colicin import membrane protein
LPPIVPPIAPPPPRVPRGGARVPASFGLSLAMHLLLFAALAFAVRWKVEPQGAVVAELWGLPANVEAPLVQPTPPVPTPPVVESSPPQIKPEPAKPEVDIALEQEKKRRAAEAEARRQAERKKAEDLVRQKERAQAEAEAAQKRTAAEADKKRQITQREQDQRLATQSAELRKQIQARTQAQAGGSGAPGAAAAVGRGSADAGYAAQVIACIRPHIVYAVPDNIQPGQYRTEFVVQLLPSGEQVGSPRLDRPSGLAGFDGAVERAIRRCDPFPRKKDGTVDRTVTVIVDPVDTR